MSSLNEIKEEMLGMFQVLEKGHVVSPGMMQDFASMFEDDEKGLVDAAVKELITEGVVSEKLEIL
jgi:hypothetical protein